MVQNIELRGYYDVLAQPTSVEWGPLVMFLVTMVARWCVVTILASFFFLAGPAAIPGAVAKGTPSFGEGEGDK